MLEQLRSGAGGTAATARHGVTPFRYGDHVATFSIEPVSTSLAEPTDREIDACGNPDAIRDSLPAEAATTGGV